VPKPAKSPAKKSDSSANIGFEAKLWLEADKLRNNLDAAEKFVEADEGKLGDIIICGQES
jgi:hypothetical protein